MRYPASEKLEIIRIVEQSHLPVRRTLDKLGVLPGSFYRWYDRYQSGGIEALEDKPSKPTRVWNRIPDDVRQRIIDMALDEPELSPRELAARFTDTQKYFVSEASVYRLLKTHISSPARPSSSSKRRMSSRTRQPRSISSGRQTSRTSRSSAGDGSICPRSSTTTPATSSPGSCAPR